MNKKQSERGVPVYPKTSSKSDWNPQKPYVKKGKVVECPERGRCQYGEKK